MLRDCLSSWRSELISRNTETLEAGGLGGVSYIVERMKGQGILLSTEGPRHNVLKLKPPLIFRREDKGQCNPRHYALPLQRLQETVLGQVQVDHAQFEVGL